VIVTIARTEHLTEAQIIQAVVNRSDLSDDMLEHLATCLECRAEETRLCAALGQLGKMAQASVPKNEMRFAWPSGQSEKGKTGFFENRSITRMAVPALVLLMVVLGTLLINPDQKPHIKEMALHMIDPEQLLSDIDNLLETPVPPEFQTTVSFIEIDPEDDFMQDIVPRIENDPMTHRLKKKGVYIC
jgi:hypothetical protein